MSRWFLFYPAMIKNISPKQKSYFCRNVSAISNLMRLLIVSTHQIKSTQTNVKSALCRFTRIMRISQETLYLRRIFIQWYDVKFHFPYSIVSQYLEQHVVLYLVLTWFDYYKSCKITNELQAISRFFSMHVEPKWIHKTSGLSKLSNMPFVRDLKSYFCHPQHLDILRM